MEMDKMNENDVTKVDLEVDDQTTVENSNTNNETSHINHEIPQTPFQNGCKSLETVSDSKKPNLKLKIEPLREEDKTPDIIYGLDDVPPWHLCLILGFQHYLMMLSSLISIPYLLAPSMCILDDDPARGHMISTIMFVGGLSTLLQSTFGIRLPIVQGGTLALIIPALAILNHPKWKCGESEDSYLMVEDKDEYWMRRMREIQGGVLIAGIFEMVMGASGLLGILLRFITPLAIAPTIALIGLATFQKAASLASQNWALSILTMILLVLFSQYMQNIQVPCLAFGKTGCRTVKYPIFKVFSVLLAMVLVWIFAAILTSCGVFGEDSLARTDKKLNIITEMPWFNIPYPFQWGMPTVSAGAVLGMAAGVTASIVESIGDYYACARISNVPLPPRHAMNRGIAVEGLGCVMGGLWGSGNGTTSYSQNIAAIGITRVASRRVVQVCAIFMIVFSILGKFGALFVTVPDPIVGGMFCILFGMVTSVGLSNLQCVNLESSRNMFILGFSLFLGLAIPKWVEANNKSIQTGSEIFDQIAVILLSTPMFVGGFLGVLLDNTIPGLSSATENNDCNGLENQFKSYDFPYGMKWIRRKSFLSYVPMSPTYSESNPFIFRKKSKKNLSTVEEEEKEGLNQNGQAEF